MINPLLGLGRSGKYEATFLFQCGHENQIPPVQSFFSPFPWIGGGPAAL